MRLLALLCMFMLSGAVVASAMPTDASQKSASKLENTDSKNDKTEDE